MPTCPDCGGLMIATEPYDVKISHGRGYRGTPEYYIKWLTNVIEAHKEIPHNLRTENTLKIVGEIIDEYRESIKSDSFRTDK